MSEGTHCGACETTAAFAREGEGWGRRKRVARFSGETRKEPLSTAKVQAAALEHRRVGSA
eukprot:4714116-Pleurochrysis_carterae.AAC.2